MSMRSIGLRMRGNLLQVNDLVDREGVESPTPAFSGLYSLSPKPFFSQQLNSSRWPLYCDLAVVELATDLFIQQAGGYQHHDLPFARSERRVTVPERPYLRLATKCGLAALDGVSDGTQQHIIAEWLRQELDSARLHGLDGHRYVTVTRNKDDRHVDPIADDAFLQIETIETRKRNVKYEAARNKDSWAVEKFLCGREYFRLPAFAANQQLQRLAYGDVVVNHEHDWCAVRHG